jgi:hypothetical protein
MTWRRWLRWTYLALAVLVSLAALAPNLRLYRSAQSTASVVAQLRHLRGELRSGAGEDMQRQFPEGYFFSHVLYGLTWLDVARSDADRRHEALREARWALDRLDGREGRAPFDADLRPGYGVFYVGWSSRLRGGVIELSGPEAPEVARFVADCDALAAAFTDDGPFLEAYPGQAWPVDSTVAVAALRLHDRLLGPRFGPVVDRWVAEARRRVDPGTGLLPHRAAPRVEGARGSSQSVIQRFLPEIDPDWAESQYRRFRRLFVVTRLGQPGVREYPPGEGGAGDVDSGPLVLGVSASASVVTMGAARAHGDDALAGPLTALGEAVGMPLRFGSTKSYLLGMMPIGDAFLAWSAATRPVAPLGGHYPAVVSWWWRLPWHALTLVGLALVWLPLWGRRVRGLRHRSSTPPSGPPVGPGQSP